jgi:capsid protein
MVEPDRLDDSHDEFSRQFTQSENIAQTVHGINIDSRGRPVSYRFTGIDSEISARNIIHSYFIDRPEQYIGVPLFVAALDSIYDKHDLFEDFVLKSRAISKILWFLSNKNDDMPGTDDTDEDDNIQLDPLVQMRGEEPPQDVKFPDNVNDTVAPLVKLLSHGICAAGGTSHTTVMRDMEGVNFAAANYVGIQERSAIDVGRDFFIEDFCNPFYEKFLSLEVALGKCSINPVEYLKEPWRFEEVTWIGAGKQHVNPLQDNQADALALKTGMATYEDILSKRGKDVDEHFETIQKERAKIEEMGLGDILKDKPESNAEPMKEGVQSEEMV